METTFETFMNQLRADLLEARKTKDTVRMQALKSLIARVDNAEAIPTAQTGVEVDSQFFAGAKSGLGSTEAERKILTMQDIQNIITSEIAEIEATLNDLKDSGQGARIEELKKHTELLQNLNGTI